MLARLRKHRGDRLVGGEHRGAAPHMLSVRRLPLKAHDLAFGDVIFTGEQRPTQQPYFLVCEQSDGRAADRKPVLARAVLKQHAQHLHGNNGPAPGIEFP